MKRINLVLVGLTLIIVSIFSINASSVNAQYKTACDGLVGITDNGADSCGESSSDTGGIDNAIENGLNLLSLVAGILAVVMIMLSGLKFINSQGDPGRIASAKNTLIYAIVGVGIVALSQIIVFFIVGNKTVAPPTNNNGDTQQLNGPR